MSKKNYIKSLNTKSNKNYAKFYSSSISNSNSNPFYWFNMSEEDSKSVEIKNLIQGWKCFSQRNAHGICITCESKKLEFGMYVRIVASTRNSVSEYWMSFLNTKNNTLKEEDINIEISIRSGNKNIEKSMNMLFFSPYGAGISFSMKEHKKIFDIMINMHEYVEKIKSRIIMENISYEK